MTVNFESVLDEILVEKREQLKKARRIMPLERIQRETEEPRDERDFVAALKDKGLSLIAEIKRSSPTAGPLRETIEIESSGRAYESGGARAISVLTEELFFGGQLDHVRVIKESCSLPILRKDFLFDEYHIYESRAAGADALLLITMLFSESHLRELINLSDELGLAALVEVHDDQELEKALAAGAATIGINNRDLKTMNVNLETTARLRPHIPAGVPVVSESGIKTRADTDYLRDQGVDAVLIGETLMRSEDIGSTLLDLGFS